MVDPKGQAHFRKVDIQRDLGRRLEIARGLRAGEEVILFPPADLREGEKVLTRRAPAEKSP